MAQFARTWRPKQFEDVVGQELVISILRNTLYKNSVFPVYLFVGQRGCGKTTLARIFAMAINCARRTEFTERPHEVAIPCQQCASCIAMHDGSHTDFHEIDAASHTGVDHIRSILEATLLVPQLGSKRIYLIDEVHMLSRAACNALLKTLEEPFDSVVFLLATTDPHKIIDTVRSRCFQLFLKPFSRDQIAQRLAYICDREAISYDQEGLLRLTHSAEGSLRDAINALERAVISYGRVSHDEVGALLGMISLADIIDLLEAVAAADVARTLHRARSAQISLAGVPQTCRMLCEVFRALVALNYGVIAADMLFYEDRLKTLLASYTLGRIIEGWETIYVMEQRMVKSACPQVAFELTLVKLCGATPKPAGGEGQHKVMVTGNSAHHKEVVAPVKQPQGPAMVPSGEALWEQVLANMQNSGSNRDSVRRATRTAPAERASVPASTPVVYDEITKKILTLFPGTLTQAGEGETI